jgi:hypothetical protein
MTAAPKLSESDIAAIADAVAERLARHMPFKRPSRDDSEPDGPVRVTAADLERVAQRRAQRGAPKRRRRR